MRWCCWCADAADALMPVMRWCCWHSDGWFLTVSRRFLLFLTVFHRFSLFLTIFCCFSPFVTVSHCFSLFLTISHSFSLFLSVSHHESICCWPCWPGGFCGVSTDKSPTWRGPTCQGVLGLVFHGFPGTSIRPHYMPVKRAECFPFRDFSL